MNYTLNNSKDTYFRINCSIEKNAYLNTVNNLLFPVLFSSSDLF